MSNHPTASWPARVRRAWAERRAAATGLLSRPDIAAAFGVSSQQASADIQGLLAEHPGCLAYDRRAKRYRWTGDQPRLPIPAPIAAFTDIPES